MGDLDRSFVVAIHGARPSFDPAAGEMMALVRVEAGADQVLVDRERDRCRVERTPARRDLDKWCSPTGLILAARRGEWGLAIVEDRYAGDGGGPADFGRSAVRPIDAMAPREPVRVRGRFHRHSIPRDVCSCLRCRDLVIARRPRRCPYLVVLAAPGRSYRKILRCLAWWSPCQGPGAAGVDHGRDCRPFRMAEAGAIRRARARRVRGLLLDQLLGRLMGDPVASTWLEGGYRDRP